MSNALKRETLKIARTAGRDDRVSISSDFVDEGLKYKGRNLPNAMTVDVEEYFQVSAFEDQISKDDWLGMPKRLPGNIDKILAIFDEFDVHATFFTLGWICKTYPEVIRRIASCGHEIASHGHDHARIGTLSPAKFRDDVESTRKLLEDVAGAKVIGYRAPSFSIDRRTLWAYEALSEAGYRYSSSVFPIVHDHYGLPEAPRYPFRLAADDILEIPMSSLAMFGRNWPCSGGGYFRLLPLAYSKWATRQINSKEGMPTMFYFHPWEIDPGQPRVSGISTKAKFRHYVNLHKFEARLREMLREFRWSRVDQVFLDSQ